MKLNFGSVEVRDHHNVYVEDEQHKFVKPDLLGVHYFTDVCIELDPEKRNVSTKV